MRRIPVHILTGFLGAGKTTFLNHFIRSHQSERLFIIENEVGKENIDGGLLMEVDEIVELTSGCLCCSLNDKLLDVLEEASLRREEYDRIIIETTGIADPSNIAAAFVSNPMVERVFDLINVICITDAVHISEWLQETEEARRQLVMADFVLLNKTDLLDEEQIERSCQLVKAITPYAKVYRGSHGIFPIEPILTTHQSKLDERVLVAQASGDTEAHDIKTVVLYYDQKFNLQALGYELKRLLFLHAHQIYRIKGIIATDHPQRVIVQSVAKNFVFTSGEAWEEGQKRQAKIVCIGKSVEKKAIDKIFQRALQR